jgi:outer membrane protein assembly factor BamB
MAVLRTLALMALPLLLGAGDPAMFRGGPDHAGNYPSAQSPTLASVKWRFSTGAKILSSPAVLDGVVYVGSADGNLYALDARDGKRKWSYATGGAVNGSPACDGRRVIVSSLDGLIHAVDAVSGKAIWTFRTGGERRFSAPGIHGAQPATEQMPDPFDVFLSSPALSGGTVFIGSGDHHVYALDAASGALKWKFATGDVVHASPAVAGGVVYIGSWDRRLYALDAATGAMKWAFVTGDDPEQHNQIGIASSAAVAGGIVYFGCRDGHFYALDAADGRLHWKLDNHKGWVIASAALAGATVCFPTSDGTRFKALDGPSGKLLFDLANRAISFSSPAVTGKLAYYGSSDGWVHRVDLAAGRETAAFQTDGSRANAAKYTDAEGRLVSRALYPSGTLDGMIIGLERMFTLGSVLSSPVIADGVLFVGSTDGTVYALN